MWMDATRRIGDPCNFNKHKQVLIAWATPIFGRLWRAVKKVMGSVFLPFDMMILGFYQNSDLVSHGVTAGTPSPPLATILSSGKHGLQRRDKTLQTCPTQALAGRSVE